MGDYYYEEGGSVVQSTLFPKAITSGAKKSGIPLENSLSFDSQLSGRSTPNAAETLERCPSPDIISLLEPRNYQVGLVFLTDLHAVYMVHCFRAIRKKL